MRFTSFQTRLIVFFSGLLALALAASFLAVNQASIANARRVIIDDLTEDAAVFTRLFGERTGHLLEAARLLSSDYAFKAAYSTGDHDTILSAMDNHMSRIAGADLMLMISLDDEVVVDTRAPESTSGRANPWPWIVEAAAEDDYGEAAAVVSEGDQIYQMMVVPLLVPDLDAWILIGFRIDNSFADDFRRLVLSHVSILQRTPAEGFRTVASTLPPELRAPLAAMIGAGRLAAGEAQAVQLGGDDYLSSLVELSTRGEVGALVVLQRPLAEELAPYLRLRLTLLGLFVVSLAASVAAAVAIARSVTRPVLDLAARARRIEAGDYAQRIEIGRSDEIGTLAGSFNLMAKGLAEKERVRDLLGKVVSQAIAEELLSKEIELGGEERIVTVLFSDVRNFTTLCEGRTPREILALLNLYLTEVSGVIEREEGVVDKYIGDAVMALFGAPLSQPDDAARAVRAGLGMCDCLAQLNLQFRDRGWPTLGIGIGIHTDLVVAGNMGSESRLNYTVIGDGVNLASRLEGLTKRYGVSLIVSDATRAAAPDFVYRELDRVRVKGKSQAVGIFEPLGASDRVAEHDRDELGRFHAALAQLRAGDFRSARSSFAALAEGASGESGARLYRVYLERTDAFLQRPPDLPWDGTIEYSEK